MTPGMTLTDSVTEQVDTVGCGLLYTKITHSSSSNGAIGILAWIEYTAYLPCKVYLMKCNLTCCITQKSDRTPPNLTPESKQAIWPTRKALVSRDQLKIALTTSWGGGDSQLLHSVTGDTHPRAAWCAGNWFTDRSTYSLIIFMDLH